MVVLVSVFPDNKYPKGYDMIGTAPINLPSIGRQLLFRYVESAREYCSRKLKAQHCRFFAEQFHYGRIASCQWRRVRESENGKVEYDRLFVVMMLFVVMISFYLWYGLMIHRNSTLG